MAVFNFTLSGKDEVKIKLTYFGDPNPIIATYIYRLKSTAANKPIQEFSGDNQNSEDDIYTLPSPLNDNKGRYILISNEISRFNGNSKYTIQVDVVQDGTTTNTFEDKGEVATGEPSHSKIIKLNIQ